MTTEETTMAQRVSFPADVCSEPGSPCRRTIDLGLTTPENAVALKKYEQPPVWRWLLAALIVLLAGVLLSGCDAEAAPEQPLTKAELGAVKACPKGYAVEWLSKAEMQCLKESL